MREHYRDGFETRGGKDASSVRVPRKRTWAGEGPHPQDVADEARAAVLRSRREQLEQTGITDESRERLMRLFGRSA